MRKEWDRAGAKPGWAGQAVGSRVGHVTYPSIRSPAFRCAHPGRTIAAGGLVKGGAAGCEWVCVQVRWVWRDTVMGHVLER